MFPRLSGGAPRGHGPSSANARNKLVGIHRLSFVRASGPVRDAQAARYRQRVLKLATDRASIRIGRPGIGETID